MRFFLNIDIHIFWTVGIDDSYFLKKSYWTNLEYSRVVKHGSNVDWIPGIQDCLVPMETQCTAAIVSTDVCLLSIFVKHVKHGSNVDWIPGIQDCLVPMETQCTAAIVSTDVCLFITYNCKEKELQIILPITSTALVQNRHIKLENQRFNYIKFHVYHGGHGHRTACNLHFYISKSM